MKKTREVHPSPPLTLLQRYRGPGAQRWRQRRCESFPEEARRRRTRGFPAGATEKKILDLLQHRSRPRCGISPARVSGDRWFLWEWSLAWLGYGLCCTWSLSVVSSTVMMRRDFFGKFGKLMGCGTLCVYNEMMGSKFPDHFFWKFGTKNLE